jgi:hypothetical protein
MSDDVRIWTTVGSAGTLSATDLAKVTLDNAVITLGVDVAPPVGLAAQDPSVVLPPRTAVVRYNVTPVDGLFPVDDMGLVTRFHYVLQLTYRGRVRARLVQFDLSSGTEKDLLQFDSASFAPAHRFATNGGTTRCDSAVMDFVNFAYYVEATLSASAIVVGNPAEIAVVKVLASADFSQ